ncbi:MAG: AAA family ATPase, partial [Eubacteriales bacterium]|nr:AAA family ATPase [Eubacteriales bacterium]
MRLKAIEMQGFKSFIERTKMTFDGGITAVIGPNGSGKSNISDAIRWVLGEMSAKSLRGSKMEDVIFNGTDKRPAANYAAVSIYLDTSAEHAADNFSGITENGSDENTADKDIPGVMPKTRLSDTEEFVITRKYYRSGESEYYINKKQVRLKDVYELFYDTGIGREGYSVIGQGKIAEVLSVKGDERRSIFEEAAGISKFRFKKQEAERRLRDTDQNLERVNDILAEVESRVEPLYKEAENAKKYLILAQEKKELEITIWLEKTDALRESLDGGERTLASSKLELELASDELGSIEKEDEEFTNQGYALMRRKSELDNKAAETASLSAELVRQNSVFENDAGHYTEKIESGRRESELVTGRKTLIEEQIASCERELAGTVSCAERLKAESDMLTAERDAILAPGVSVIQRKENAVAAAVEAAEKLSIVMTEAVSCRTLITAADKSGDSFGVQLEQSRARLSGLREEKDKLGSEERTKQAEISQIKNTINDIHSKVKKLEEERSAGEKNVSSLKVKAAAAEEQRGALLRLERLFEGYSDSVKTVMRQAAEGRIKTSGKPIDIRGTVASLLSTEGEYVVAIETALGASVQFIVSGTEADAKAALNYLKTTGGGRITVLPLDTVKGRRYDVSKIKDCPGFIGIASDLISCEAEYKGIADDLLGRTVIAEDIEKASVMAKKSGYTVKIVTIDGQIINAGGSYTGGSSQKKVGIFTRSSDVEKLDAEIASINNALIEAQLKHRYTEKEIERLRAEALDVSS